MPTIYMFNNYVTFSNFRNEERFMVDGKLIRATTSKTDPVVASKFNALMALAISDTGQLNVSKAIYDELYQITKTQDIEIPEGYKGKSPEEMEEIAALTADARNEMFSPDEMAFLTALACDIEVELQKRRLMCCAQYLEFDCDDKTSHMSPYFNHMEDMTLSSDDRETLDRIKTDLVTESVCLINTHGRAQELDGPFQMAVEIQAPVSRIIVDACQSANQGFPMKKGGNRTVIQKIADYAISKNKSDTLEIIGHTNVFNSTAPQTLYATFSKQPLIYSANLKNLPLMGRKTELLRTQDTRQSSVISTKQYKTSSDSAMDTPIQRNIQDIFSYYMSNALSTDFMKDPEAIEQFKNDTIFDLLPKIKGSAIECLDDAIGCLEQARASNKKPPSCKVLKAALKDIRKVAIKTLTPEDSITIGRGLLNKVKPLHITDKGYLSSIGALEGCINDSTSPPRLAGSGHAFFQMATESTTSAPCPQSPTDNEEKKDSDNGALKR